VTTAVARLRIQIRKRADGSAALSCRRADGTVTWQRQTGPQGRFFPLHDLTHYAVESVLGYRRAFYGLIAEGWGLDDFGKPWPRGPLPAEAHAAELIVGYLDAERASGTRWSADEFNRSAETYGKAPAAPAFVLTETQLGRIRAERSRLFARWRELPEGGALELDFPGA
jgi:hypothetical protein